PGPGAEAARAPARNLRAGPWRCRGARAPEDRRAARSASALRADRRPPANAPRRRRGSPCPRRLQAKRRLPVTYWQLDGGDRAAFGLAGVGGAGRDREWCPVAITTFLCAIPVHLGILPRKVRAWSH